MKSFTLEYVGNATVDKRLSNPMIPWVIAQIRRGIRNKTVRVRIDMGVLYCWEMKDSSDSLDEKDAFHVHPLLQVSRLTLTPTTIFYSVRHPDNQLLTCHLYQSQDPEQIMEVVSQMREQSARLTSSQGQPSGQTNGQPALKSSSSSTMLCPDISPSSSQFFEVLYIGKIKVSHKKVPDSFIDDALDKFSHLEKVRKQKEFNNSQESEDESFHKTSMPSRYGSTETLKDPSATEYQPHKILGRKRSGSAGSVILIKKPETLERLRELASAAVNTQPASQDDHNRTMVFHVGRSDLRLISPDRKQVLLHKYIKDIINCLQGMKHGSHFAFICRESGIEQPHYIGYVFKCESSSVASDVVNAITQALGCGRKDGSKVPHGPVMSCEHCPLVWYHKLCHEVEACSPDISSQVHAVMKRVEMLPEDEQVIVETKLAGAAALEPSTSRERLELLMMLLRAHCEAKQATHVHDTPQARHEFLNHYLGGGTIFMKAKRSLTNSFDQLLKRKGSRDDLSPILKVLSLPPNATICKDDVLSESGLAEEDPNSDSEEKSGGPMKNIFLKVGHSPGISNGGYKSETESEEDEKPSSWRQAIFNTVVTPSKAPPPEPQLKRDKEYFRLLWKKAINQQVLLIRMDKENAKLTAHQEEANVKRIKLEYDDLGCKESSPVWDMVVNKDLAQSCDQNLLMNALIQGIPKSKRGEVWLCLAERYTSNCSPVQIDKFPNYYIPYENLLKQLTSHQHAILIDLGRTFPSHKYFSSPLGPGQLALFNILKAYSLLDPEVGYCQGLSFIAAVLLLHMSEEESFYLLKQVMFLRGLRARYLPDMSALQVHLYQLSRLLLDNHPQLYKHFDKHDVSPTLYAAPWLLTLFASQFPLGFVARIFDIMLADSPDVMFKIALALLGHHKDQLLECNSFESIMDYLKKDLPVIDKNIMDNIMVEVLRKDITKELTEYGVEYHVLHEEMSSPRPETKKIKQLEISNQSLVSQNKALAEQLQIATSNINRLESSRGSHLAQINKLESQVKSLEVTISLLGEFISTITYGNSDIEIPNEIVRILTTLSRKENGKRLMRSAPLRVIEDPQEQPAVPKRESSNLSQRVSNLFRNSSSSDLTDNNKIGRMLSEKEKEGLLSRLRGNKRDSIDSSKPLLKSTQSSFELLSNGSNNSNGLPLNSNGLPLNSIGLPLDSNGVHISYEGTTKLKSIHPLRARNTLNSIPLLNERQSQVELKIIEKDDDEITNKIKATMNKVTNLFDSDECLDKNKTLSNDNLSIKS